MQHVAGHQMDGSCRVVQRWLPLIPMIRFVSVIILTLVLSLGSSRTIFGQASGKMRDLGTLGGLTSTAFGINDADQVVGISDTTPGLGKGHGLEGSHAFLWTPGGTDGVKGNPQMKDLGTLGGPLSQANDVNNAGQVVGLSFNAEGVEHAVLWNPGSGGEMLMMDLGTLGGENSEAISTNEQGQVVGFSETGDGGIHAFLWTPGGTDGVTGNPQMKDLGTLEDFSSLASGINESGQISGIVAHLDANGEPTEIHAVLWTPEHDIVILDALGGFNSGAQGINNSGQVVGAGETLSGDLHAFLWTPTHPNGTEGSALDLGTLGGSLSFGVALNEGGQVAGDGYVTSKIHRPFPFFPDRPDHHAPYVHSFLWTQGANDGVPINPQMLDLGTLGGGSCVSEAVNNHGHVAGHSHIARTGFDHAFLWKP